MAEETSTVEATETKTSGAAPAADPIELPQRFFGGIRLGLHVGGATLVVDQGVLRLFPDGTLQQAGADPVEHVATTVRVFTPKLQPPTSNTGVLLEDDASERIALADLPAWDRKRLRAALTAAGFDVDEQRAALDIGRSEVRPSASPWPRWFQKLWSKGEVPPRR